MYLTDHRNKYADVEDIRTYQQARRARMKRMQPNYSPDRPQVGVRWVVTGLLMLALFSFTVVHLSAKTWGVWG